MKSQPARIIAGAWCIVKDGAIIRASKLYWSPAKGVTESAGQRIHRFSWPVHYA